MPDGIKGNILLYQKGNMVLSSSVISSAVFFFFSTAGATKTGNLLVNHFYNNVFDCAVKKRILTILFMFQALLTKNIMLQQTGLPLSQYGRSNALNMKWEVGSRGGTRSSTYSRIVATWFGRRSIQTAGNLQHIRLDACWTIDSRRGRTFHVQSDQLDPVRSPAYVEEKNKLWSSRGCRDHKNGVFKGNKKIMLYFNFIF